MFSEYINVLTANMTKFTVVFFLPCDMICLIQVTACLHPEDKPIRRQALKGRMPRVVLDMLQYRRENSTIAPYKY
jgi:hypothetical protein